MRTFSGQRLREIRRERGVKLEVLAVVAGCSVRAVAGYEGGEKVPRLGTAMRLAELLHCDINDFFEDDRDAVAV